MLDGGASLSIQYGLPDAFRTLHMSATARPVGAFFAALSSRASLLIALHACGSAIFFRCFLLMYRVHSNLSPSFDPPGECPQVRPSPSGRAPERSTVPLGPFKPARIGENIGTYVTWAIVVVCDYLSQPIGSKRSVCEQKRAGQVISKKSLTTRQKHDGRSEEKWHHTHFDY